MAASAEQVYAMARRSRFFAVTCPELRLLAMRVESTAERILRKAKLGKAKETFACALERLIQDSPEYQAEEGLPIPDAIVPHVQKLLKLCREE
jgi:hypothetical protein